MPLGEAVEAEPKVRVLFFSVLRDVVGSGEVDIALPDPPTGAALLDRLEAEHAGLSAYRSAIRLAVNQAYVEPDVRLKADDEIALISPVSGG